MSHHEGTSEDRATDSNINEMPSEAQSDSDTNFEDHCVFVLKFLSENNFPMAYRHFCDELAEQDLMPRRYHAYYSRSGLPSGVRNDDGLSVPIKHGERVFSHPNCDRYKLVKRLKLESLFSRTRGRRINRADAIRLREIGGGSPQVRASTTLQDLHMKSIKGHRQAVYYVVIDGTGKYAITGSDDSLVKVWSMETALCLASCRGTEGGISGIAVNFNNTVFASSSTDCTIRVWHLPSGRAISTLKGHLACVTAITFCPKPDSYNLLSSSEDGTCRIWEVRNAAQAPTVYVIPQKPAIFCCAFNTTGTIFACGSSDNLVRIWVAQQPDEEPEILMGHESIVDSAYFSTRLLCNGTTTEKLLTCSLDGRAIVWIKENSRKWVKAYGLLVPLTGQGGSWQTVRSAYEVCAASWSLHDKFLVAFTTENSVCVWDATDGSLIHVLSGHQTNYMVLKAHPLDGKIVMTASGGTVVLWDIEAGAEIKSYSTPSERLLNGTFSPNGTSIVVSGRRGDLTIITAGGGDSFKKAKEEQFFTGDLGAVVSDAHGTIIGQEPHVGNMYEPLCDAAGMPYPNEYQLEYNRMRLGMLVRDWRSVAGFSIQPSV